MDANLEERVAEVNTHLAATLEKLGLIAAASRRIESSVVEFFPREDDGWYSPVDIVFKHALGPQPSWQDAHLKVGVWGCRKLGDTGFVSWKCFHSDRREIRGENATKMFEWLSFVLEYHGTVPPYVGVPNCIVNDNFGDLYETAARWAPDLQIVQDYSGRTKEPLEVFKFTDRLSRDVEIGMRYLGSQNATVHIDGRFMEEFSEHDHTRFLEVVRSLSGKYDGRNRYSPPKLR